jgi:hypothetical protein
MGAGALVCILMEETNLFHTSIPDFSHPLSFYGARKKMTTTGIAGTHWPAFCNCPAAPHLLCHRPAHVH